MMIVSPGRFGAGGGGGGGPTVTYRGTQTLNTAHSAHTYADVPISDGDFVVAVIQNLRNGAGQRTISTVSFEAVNGTIHAQAGVNDGVNQGIQVGVASRQTSGITTVDVIATFSGSLVASAISVYTVSGLVSTTPTDTATATGNEASSSTLDNSDAGIILAAFAGTDGTLGALSLTGVANKNGDQTITASPSGVDFRVAGGWSSGLSAQTDRTISVSSSANLEAFAAVSWA